MWTFESDSEDSGSSNALQPGPDHTTEMIQAQVPVQLDGAPLSAAGPAQDEVFATDDLKNLIFGSLPPREAAAANTTCRRWFFAFCVDEIGGKPVRLSDDCSLPPVWTFDAAALGPAGKGQAKRAVALLQLSALPSQLAKLEADVVAAMLRAESTRPPAEDSEDGDFQGDFYDWQKKYDKKRRRVVELTQQRAEKMVAASKSAWMYLQQSDIPKLSTFLRQLHLSAYPALRGGRRCEDPCWGDCSSFRCFQAPAAQGRSRRLQPERDL